MKAKIKKYFTGGELMAVQSAAKGALGTLQLAQAFPELARLRQTKPKFEVAPGVVEYAKDPVSSKFRKEAEGQLRAGYSAGIGAAQAGGARTLMQATPALYNQYSSGVRAAEAGFDQERARALGLLGQEQVRVQGMKYQDWMNQTQAASKHLSAGTTNIFGGLQDYTRYQVQDEQLGSLGGMMNPSQLLNPNSPTAQYTPEQRLILNMALQSMGATAPAANSITGTTGFGPPATPAGEKGMITDGEFSHSKNPISLMNKDGEVVGEVTGNEVVLNPEQAKSAAAESPYLRKLLKQFKRRK